MTPLAYALLGTLAALLAYRVGYGVGERYGRAAMQAHIDARIEKYQRQIFTLNKEIGRLKGRKAT